MTRTSILILIVVTAVAIAAAAVMRSSQAPSGEQAEGSYFPALIERSNDVAKAIIKGGGKTTTLIKEGEVWSIAEKDRYPASLDRVRELVLGLARLQRIEAKTSRPELYGKLGLDGIGDPESTSMLFQLLDSSGETLAVLIAGNEKMTQGNKSRRRFYVRSPAEPQAWLVEGRLPEPGDTTVWLDNSIFGEGAPAIRSVTVSQGGKTWTVSRENTETEVFQLEGLAAGEEIDSQYAINQVARSLGDLEFEDVRSVPEGAGESRVDTIVAETFDDVHITLSVRKSGGQYFGRISAEYKPAGEAQDTTLSKVRAWNDKWRGWEYLLADYQLENITTARENLIKQEAGEAALQ